MLSIQLTVSISKNTLLLPFLVFISAPLPCLTDKHPDRNPGTLPSLLVLRKWSYDSAKKGLKRKKIVKVSPTDNVDFSLLTQLLQALVCPMIYFVAANLIMKISHDDSLPVRVSSGLPPIPLFY